MKKLLLLSILLVPAVPCFLAGIDTTKTMNDDRRAAMMEQCFIQWCGRNGYDYHALTRSERETLYLDVWSELDEYQEAQDSIDQVMSDRVINYMLND